MNAETDVLMPFDTLMRKAAIVAGMLIIAVIIPLVMITIGQEFLKSGATEISWYQTLGTILLTTREKWVHLVLPFFYSLSGVVFFWFLYKKRLVPKFLSILGMIGAGGNTYGFFQVQAGCIRWRLDGAD